MSKTKKDCCPSRGRCSHCNGHFPISQYGMQKMKDRYPSFDTMVKCFHCNGSFPISQYGYILRVKKTFPMINELEAEVILRCPGCLADYTFNHVGVRFVGSTGKLCVEEDFIYLPHMEISGVKLCDGPLAKALPDPEGPKTSQPRSRTKRSKS